MKLSADHLKRYRQIARLLWKYGRGDLVRQMGVDGALEPEHETSDGKTKPEPSELADDLEAMGPTFVKLGQVLSGRRDLLPEPYLNALARLQDKVKPFSFEDVERAVESELGSRISKAFSSFDPKPVAAASLGQVHLAALRDGRPVVVKVRRPGIQQQIAEDFEVLERIAAFFDAHTQIGRRHHVGAMLEEFRLTIQHELDYEREAESLRRLGENMREFERIHVPQPIPDYCSAGVLTMERVQGHKITSLSPAAMLEVDGSLLAEDLLKAYLQQVLIDGFFHADPHPGNVFLTSDGRIALLDLGMVGHTTPGMQEKLLKLLLAISAGQAGQAADLVIRMSEPSEDFAEEEFRRHVRQQLDSGRGLSLEQRSVGSSLLEVGHHAGANGLFVPSELTLLGKTLLQLDEIGRVLDPRFDPNAAIRRNVSQIVRKRMAHTSTRGSLFTTLLDTRAFMMGLPSRLNRILDAVADAELEVKVKSLDAKMVVESIEKVANRITTGLVLAALIVGAALLMRVDTRFRLFGYPGLAMVCFLVAATGGFWLVASTLVQDHRSKKKRSR